MVDFTGQIAWRGLVPTERLQTQPPEGVSVWVGPGKHFVGYRLRQSSLMNFIAVEERDEWTEENWMLSGDIKKLRTAFAGWDSTVQDILAACDDAYLWGLFDRPPPKTWHSARAVLIGDACHPILPFMAQGAAMAIEDAYVLATSLENSTSIAAALKLFQQQRKKRVKSLYDISRFITRPLHFIMHPDTFISVEGICAVNLFLKNASGDLAEAFGSRIFPKIISYQMDSLFSIQL